MRSILVGLGLMVGFAVGYGLSGCTSQKAPVVNTVEHSEYKSEGCRKMTVTKLFTHDGCTVYDFYGEGCARGYFTNCNGGVGWETKEGTAKTRRFKKWHNATRTTE